jgi:hypothetical protein
MKWAKCRRQTESQSPADDSANSSGIGIPERVNHLLARFRGQAVRGGLGGSLCPHRIVDDDELLSELPTGMTDEAVQAHAIPFRPGQFSIQPIGHDPGGCFTVEGEYELDFS